MFFSFTLASKLDKTIGLGKAFQFRHQEAVEYVVSETNSKTNYYWPSPEVLCLICIHLVLSRAYIPLIAWVNFWEVL